MWEVGGLICEAEPGEKLSSKGGHSISSGGHRQPPASSPPGTHLLTSCIIEPGFFLQAGIQPTLCPSRIGCFYFCSVARDDSRVLSCCSLRAPLPSPALSPFSTPVGFTLSVGCLVRGHQSGDSVALSFSVHSLMYPFLRA